VRSHDYERPAFGFTRYCLFSIVFVKYHGKTIVNRFIHDLASRSLSDQYTAKLGSGGPHSRFVLDFLIESWKVRGDFFFLFNTGSECRDHRDVISAENIDVLGRPNPAEDRTGHATPLDSLRSYLGRLVAPYPDIAAVHFIPRVPAEGINLSIAFAFRKSGRQYPAVVHEILNSRSEIQAYMYNVLSVLEGNDLVNESMRTAVGAIIGRVNAHDFGHVLNNARIDFAGDLENAEAYFNHFRSFLRGLMVFGSEVATGDPSWSIPLPFMSQLIHYFTSTGQRSNETESDGWYRFDPSPVCRHLAESEQISQIRVCVFIDGEQVEYLFEDAVKLRRSVRLSDRRPLDVLVSIPTGLIGAHALYCILENVIRNGAKYGGSEGSRPNELVLSIDLCTKVPELDEFIRVRVWDDHSRFGPGRPSGFEKVCEFFPPDSRPSYLNIISQDCAKAICPVWRVVDDQGQLVSGGWGIKEMRITAAWLRQQRVAEALSGNEFRPPLLRPIVVGNDGRTVEFDIHGNVGGEFSDGCARYLGYEFYLYKPRDILLVGAEKSEQKSALGIDAVRDLNAAMERGTSHRMWIIGAADKEVLSAVQQHRQEIPPTLVICPQKGLRMPESEVSVSDELLRSIVYPDTPEDQMRAAQAAHRLWLRRVLGAPERLALILQLSPHQGKCPLKEVAGPWCSLEKFFGPAADGTDWRLDIGDETIEMRFGYDSLVYDYHNVWGGTHRHGRAQPSFYEPYQGTQPTQALIFNPPADEWIRLRTVMGLIEAAVAKVAVVDERIFSRSQNADRESEFGAAGIHIPSEIDYSSPSEDDFKRLQNWLAKKQIRILAIHQGMIDKAFRAREDHIDDWVAQTKSIVPIIVVQSDRGEALLPRLPREVRFVPYSSVEPWFTGEGTNKYFLVQTLLSARRRAVIHGKETAGSR
jgi:hypothetical protein